MQNKQKKQNNKDQKSMQYKTNKQKEIKRQSLKPKTGSWK